MPATSLVGQCQKNITYIFDSYNDMITNFKEALANTYFTWDDYLTTDSY